VTAAALDRHMKHQRLLPETRTQYSRIAARVEGEDPVAWLNRHIHARTPIGTVLPMRAAVKHMLLSEGYTAEDVNSMLPKARGRPSGTRDSLSPEQLACYYAAASEVPDPVRTILLLLPRTGLRISEACGLHRRDLVKRHGGFGLLFRGKRDKERFVPLNRPARKVLKDYLQQSRAPEWLFPGQAGGPIGPPAVRKVCRRLRALHPELGDLTPHTLRHTFATTALRRGMDLRTLQALLGHESLDTTSRYLHPDAGMLTRAMNALE
jgi:site-specific recombinase XerD